MRCIVCGLLLLAAAVICPFVFADTIYLENGDKVTGIVLEETGSTVRVHTDLFGEFTLSKDLINRVEAANVVKVPEGQPPVLTAKVWQSKIGAGYQVTNGNNKTANANVTLDSKYKKDNQEWLIRGELYYGSSEGKMNAQKYFARAQSNSNFIRNPKWFTTRAFEADHDRFSNIDYRLLPSVGIGYNFRDDQVSKIATDISIGWEYTNFRDDSKSSSVATLIPHVYFDRVIVGKMKFSQDLTMYPTFERFEDYRVRSLSSITNPLTERLSWRMSFLDEYNSNPRGDAKKNDTTFLTALEFSF